MEKISHIVRGNSRVASTDLKNAAPVRPGTPSFGRPVGESTAVNTNATSTAARAVAMHNEMQERKKVGGPDEVVQQMADQFFMTRIARPQDPAEPTVAPVDGPAEDEQPEAPKKAYTPRGSFVDVRA